MAGGEARDGLNLDILGSIPCFKVPEIEQRTIADFLDAETAKLDTLVGKKRELIEKLKEKRTALISRMVTRGLPAEAARAAGLNPNPKLKPSGIEWLGDLPEHWTVKKGRFLGLLLGSASPPEESFTEDDDGTPYAKVDDLNQVDSSLSLVSTTARIHGLPAPRRKIILFPKRGAAIFTNKVAISDGALLFDSNLMGWQIFTSYQTKFVAYCLIARRLDDLADVSTVPQINNKHIYPASFPCPPHTEQHLIVKYLNRETAKIDRMVEKVEAAIQRLQEYRTALITAAVTGRIDVREIAA
jgi:type I restriction enzyme S subunit